MGKPSCYHKWAEMDKDDRFKKDGDIEFKKVKEKCINCGKERIRRIRRRLK